MKKIKKMVNNNQSVTIDLKPESIRDIEFFVDTVCDQVFINETYYGNILMSVSELFNYLIENNQNNKINVTYNSDYKTIKISFQPIDIQLIAGFSKKVDFEEIMHKDDDRKLFLIHSLVDNISLSKNDTLLFEFDISALHNDIYKKRADLLANYFSKQTISEKVQKEND